MKVIVRCAHNKVTKADMEREIERLIQENKDLRLSEARARNEGEFYRTRAVAMEKTANLWQQKHEAQRQQLVERDVRINELEACNQDLLVTTSEIDHYHKAAAIWQQKCEAIQAEREKAEAENRRVTTKFADYITESIGIREGYECDIAELRDELNDRNARVNELEKRLKWLEEENANLRAKDDRWVDTFNEQGDTVRALESQVENLKANLANTKEDYDALLVEYEQMRARATDYYERWNRLRNDDERAARFVKGMLEAIEKYSVNDTACEILKDGES